MITVGFSVGFFSTLLLQQISATDTKPKTTLTSVSLVSLLTLFPHEVSPAL
jgi:hypothetical protein